MSQYQRLTVLTLCVGALIVALGAFGAHALKNSISPDRLVWYQTGLRYGMWHVLALLIFLSRPLSYCRLWPIILGLLGIFIFTGTLAVMSITGWKVLGAITPIGGVFLICFWLAWAFIELRSS